VSDRRRGVDMALEPLLGPSATDFMQRTMAGWSRVGNRVAVLDHGTDCVLTYDELGHLVEKTATELAIAGVGPDSVLCITGALRELDVLSLAFATGLRGAGFVIGGPHIDHTGIAEWAERASATHIKNGAVISVCSNVPTSPARGQLGFATSGTTGIPKVMIHSWDGLAKNASVISRDLALGDHEVVLSAKAAHHAASFAATYLVALTAGGTLVFPRSKSDIRGLAQAIRCDGVTYCDSVCTVVDLVVPYLAGYPLSGAGLVIVANGERATAKQFNRWRAMCPSIRFVYGYGLSEAGVRVTHHHIGDVVEEPLSVGTPLSDVEVSIVEDRSLGQTRGRVAVQGPSIMLGYVVDGKLVSLRTDEYLLTNDIGSFDERGQLFLWGRLDDIVVRGGELINPVEIERVLLANCEISECVVVLAERENAKPLVCAYCSLSESMDRELRSVSRRCLPANWRPNRYLRLTSIPSGAGGKTDRSAVLDMLASKRSR
jgi:acyl-CoA synthetase (AMP-forming)/AMP-acid ligase II